MGLEEEIVDLIHRETSPLQDRILILTERDAQFDEEMLGLLTKLADLQEDVDSFDEKVELIQEAIEDLRLDDDEPPVVDEPPVIEDPEPQDPISKHEYLPETPEGAILMGANETAAVWQSAINSGKSLLFTTDEVINVPAGQHLRLQKGGTPEEPRVYGSQKPGEYARFEIMDPKEWSVFFFVTGECSNIVIQDLMITVPVRDPRDTRYDESFDKIRYAGIRVAAEADNITFQNLHLAGFGSNALTTTNNGSNNINPTGVEITQCTIRDNWYPGQNCSGCYVDIAKTGPSLKVHHNVFAFNGWNFLKPDTRLVTQNHGLYVNDTAARNNPMGELGVGCDATYNLFWGNAATGMKQHCGGNHDRNTHIEQPYALIYHGVPGSVSANLVLDITPFHTDRTKKMPQRGNSPVRGAGIGINYNGDKSKLRGVTCNANRFIRSKIRLDQVISQSITEGEVSGNIWSDDMKFHLGAILDYSRRPVHTAWLEFDEGVRHEANGPMRLEDMVDGQADVASFLGFQGTPADTVEAVLRKLDFMDTGVFVAELYEYLQESFGPKN